MTGIFSAIVKASCQGSIVILAVMALRLLLKNAPKTVFCLLWLLAGLRLALPFEIQSPFSLQPQLEDTNLSVQAQQPVQVPDILPQNPAGQTLDVPDTPAQTPDLPEGNRENTQTESFLYHVEDGVITGPLTWTDIAAQIWLLGAAAMLAASAVSYLKLKRQVREAYLIENGCFECPGLDTAFVLGFLPPKIYLPAGLTDDEKKFIFDHENTHIARHDHWFKLLGYGVLSIHWFNPLVWIGYNLLCRDMELACDEHVVKYMTLPERKAYSAALLSCGGHTARIAACPVAFGESNPKKRILNVLNYKRPTFWITLLAVIAVIFVSVCLLTSPEAKEEAQEEDLKWNLEMKATDVTPWGLTVEFIQHGPFQGYDRAELNFGSYYSLETWVDGQWEPVETIPKEYDIGWTMEAYIINRSDTTQQRVLWNWIYGELPGGKYRIGKSVMLHRPIGDSESEMFYAEFTIEEAKQPLWSMDMTEEEYLAWCRKAVEELQSREQFHISETLVYYTNDNEDSRSDVVFWRDGENWLRESYVTQMQANNDFLCYGGTLYRRMQEESSEPVWNRIDGGGQSNGNPWVCLLQWDNQNVTFEAAEEKEDELLVAVIVEGAPPTLDWDDVQAYRIMFFFDAAGNMTQAWMNACKENLSVLSTLTFEATQGSEIHRRLEKVAAQRPDAPKVNGEEQAWLEKCRTALEAYQTQGSWVIQVDNSFSGQGAMNDSSMIHWYCCGDDAYEWHEVPLDGGAMILRRLQADGKSYYGEAFYATAGADSWDNGWEPGDYNGQPISPPWPVWYRWNEADIRFVETGTEESMEYVTLAVQGSPFPGENHGIDEYQVTFLFRGDAVHFVEIGYSQTDSWGDITDVEKRYDLYLMAPGDAEKMIQQRYSEALLHVHGICNDPGCTDSGHDHSGITCTDEHCTNATHHHDHNH